MDFIKRIGTDRHKFKLQFFLKSLSCNAKLKGDVYVKIKRGDHKLNSENKASLQDDGTCDFGRQILSFDSLTLFYDTDKKNYQEKQGQISVIIVTKKGDKKLLGSFQFDVAEYANSGKENIQVKKQFGEKIKAVLQYDVFIKYLGQASQKSRSIDKPLDRKKQSSLSKFTSFFVGAKNQNQQKQDSNSQDQKKNKVKRKQRANSNSKNETKQSSKQKKDDFKYYSNIVKKNNNAGSQKKMPQKQPQKKKAIQKQQNQSDQGSQNNTPEKPAKNLVNVKKKDNFTEVQYSQQKVKVNPKKKISSPEPPQQQQIYFDQPGNYIKKKNQTEYVPQPQQKPSKINKRTENSAYAKQKNETKQQSQNFNKKVNEFNMKNDSQNNNPQLQKAVTQLKDKNTTLQKQYKQLKSQNLKLVQQNRSLNKKIESLQKNRSTQDFYSTQRQNKNSKGEDQRIKALQKQKGDLLVKVQKLEQKYKKDFQKYEQKVEQYQQQKRQVQQTSKAQIKRLKQQFSQQKQKYQKLMSKYEQKVNEGKQFKQKQNDLRQRLAIAQNSLSQIKLKIGDKLNQANQQGNRTVIDILTLLSQ